ncbi:MAG: D-lyxose/D-mannose family sugar isomerase [bacterium]|nr:D-lyxose/D-mannose family sugar isomerase [bacterium]
MKRSEINGLIREAAAFFERCRVFLPPFAHWTPEEWRRRAPEAGEIIECGLGWDVTDFGSGDFYRRGLLLFTLRNGRPQNLKIGRGKIYAEKIMVAREEQVTPWHFHRDKTEDIINRGQGELVLRLANATPDEALADTPVEVMVDAVPRRVAARGTMTLGPGESITLTPGLYHTFWGRPGAGPALVGEVSAVNDDVTDNRFLEVVGRFPEIDEDEPPWRLLCGDYATLV